MGGCGGFSNREENGVMDFELQDRKSTSYREAQQERRKKTSWRSLVEHRKERGKSGNRNTTRGSHL